MPLTKQIKNKTENHGVQVFVDYDGRQPTVTGDRWLGNKLSGWQPAGW